MSYRRRLTDMQDVQLVEARVSRLSVLTCVDGQTDRQLMSGHGRHVPRCQQLSLSHIDARPPPLPRRERLRQPLIHLEPAHYIDHAHRQTLPQTTATLISITRPFLVICNGFNAVTEKPTKCTPIN